MHEQLLNRRDVLKGAIGLGAFALTSDVVKSHEVTPSYIEPIKYLEGPSAIGKAAHLTRILAESIEAVNDRTPKIKTLTDVRQFSEEFVPYLELIGAQTGENLFYPRFRTKDFGSDGGGAFGDFYLMAYAECGAGNEYYGIEPGDGSITLNERFFHPQSAMQRPDRNHKLVGTIAHEISHSNQVSCEPTIPVLGDINMMEGTTQIVAMNTLFAMTMDGNPYALPAALGILQDLAQGYVLVEQNKRGTLTGYEELLGNLPNHIEEEGYFALVRAEGQTAFQGYLNAMNTYCARPYAVVADAMVAPEYETTDLPLPTWSIKLPHTQFVLSNLSHFIEK